MRVAPKRTLRSTANPQAAVAAVHEIARSLPADVASAVAQLDVSRLDAMTTFLERWFTKGTEGASSAQVKLEKIVESGYFGVAFDEQALLRTALEARVVADVFPDNAEQASADPRPARSAARSHARRARRSVPEARRRGVGRRARLDERRSRGARSAHREGRARPRRRERAVLPDSTADPRAPRRRPRSCARRRSRGSSSACASRSPSRAPSNKPRRSSKRTCRRSSARAS